MNFCQEGQWMAIHNDSKESIKTDRPVEMEIRGGLLRNSVPLNYFHYVNRLAENRCLD